MKTTMKAALFFGKKKDMRIEDVGRPQVGKGDVLLKIKACGICGSDARSYFTGTENRYKIPIILGHELSAEVHETGENVKNYHPGDRVIVAPIYGCGQCEFCTSGKENICRDVVVFGCTYDGGFAEYMLIPEKGVERGVLVKIPQALTDAEGTMIEPLSCCLHGLRRLDLQPGDSVAIFGAGPIGISHMMIAKKLGAGKVAVIDMVKLRLESASRFGADTTFNTQEKDWEDHLDDYFGSNGVDIIITAAPSVRAAEIGYSLVKNGGKMLIFGGLPHGSMWTMDPNILHYNEITITGSIDATIDDFRRALSMAPDLDLKRFITHTISLDDVKEGMEMIKRKEGMKVVMDMEQ